MPGTPEERYLRLVPDLQGSNDSRRGSFSGPRDSEVVQQKPRRRRLRECIAKVVAHWPIIDPRESEGLERWDRFMCFILFIITCCAPYSAAFLDLHFSDPISVLCLIGDGFFICDMCLQPFTAEPDPKRPGFYMKDPWVMVKWYFTGWFLPDLASVLPPLLEFYLNYGVESPPRYMRLCRLLRLFRLRHLAQIAHRQNSSLGISYSVVSMGKFIIGASFCAHWMSCLWGGIAFQARHDESSHTWIDALKTSKSGPDELYETASGVYGMSLYWAIMTLTSIGYGDINAQTESEYWVASFCMVCMACTWAYVIGEICGLVATLNPGEVHFKQMMDDLNWLMRDRELEPNLRKKLRRYFQESRNLQRLEEQKALVDQMSPMLQGEISMCVLGPWLQKVPYMKDMAGDIVAHIARKLRSLLYAPKEKILYARMLLIVQRGACAKRGRIMLGGDVWGEDMVLSNPVLRWPWEVRCLTYVELLALRYRDLIEIMVANKEAQAAMKWWAFKRSLMRAYKMLSKFTRVWDQTYPQGVVVNMDGNVRMYMMKLLLSGEITVDPNDQASLKKQVLLMSARLEESMNADGILARGTSRRDAPPLSPLGTKTKSNVLRRFESNCKPVPEERGIDKDGQQLKGDAADIADIKVALADLSAVMRDFNEHLGQTQAAVLNLKEQYNGAT